MKKKKFLAIATVLVAIMLVSVVGTTATKVDTTEESEDEECPCCGGGTRDGEEDDFLIAVCPIINNELNNIINDYETSGEITITPITGALQTTCYSQQQLFLPIKMPFLTNSLFQQIEYETIEEQNQNEENIPALKINHKFSPYQIKENAFFSSLKFKIGNNENNDLTDDEVYMRAVELQGFCYHLGSGGSAEDYDGFTDDWFGDNDDMPSSGSCGVNSAVGYFAAVLVCTGAAIAGVGLSMGAMGAVLGYISMAQTVSLSALVALLWSFWEITHDAAVQLANQIYNMYHDCIDDLSSVFCG